MPLGRRTDCGDARFAGVELALPASNVEAVLQVKMLPPHHRRLRELKRFLVAQDIANCGFDFVATSLRRSSNTGEDTRSLQPLTYDNALLAPAGRSGQARTHVSVSRCKPEEMVAHGVTCTYPIHTPNSLSRCPALHAMDKNTKDSITHFVPGHFLHRTSSKPVQDTPACRL